MAVAIVAMATAVVVPAVSNLTRLDLRRGGRQLAANLRRAFDESAITGRTYRVVFRLPPPPGAPPKSKVEEELPPIGVEAADGGMTFSGRDGALQLAADANVADEPSLSSFDTYFEGSGIATAPPPAPADGAPASASGDTFRAMFGINRLAKQNNQAQFLPEAEIDLPAGIEVFAVWVEGMREASQTGDVSLLFFPAGYTQHAVVYLRDSNENAVSVTVEALTGRIGIEDGAVPPPDERDEGSR